MSRDRPNRPLFARAALLLLGAVLLAFGFYYFLAGAIGVIWTFPSEVKLSDIWVVLVWTILGAAGVGVGVNLLRSASGGKIDPIARAGLLVMAILYLAVAAGGLLVSEGFRSMSIRHIFELVLLLGLSVVCYVVSVRRKCKNHDECPPAH